MRSGSLWLVALAAALFGVLVCTGGWSPLALVGATGTLFAKAKLGLWLVTAILAVCGGPLLLLWVFVKGPPPKDDGVQVAGSVLLVLAGLALTAAALFKLPLLAAVLATMFLGF